MGCLQVEIPTSYMVGLTICCEAGWRAAKMREQAPRRMMGAADRRVGVTAPPRKTIRAIET
jgi:hypothetical protein